MILLEPRGGPPTEKKKVKQSRFPPCWDEERVQRVLAHYEEQAETEAVAEDEAALDDQTQTITDANDSPPQPAGSRP